MVLGVVVEFEVLFGVVSGVGAAVPAGGVAVCGVGLAVPTGGVAVEGAELFGLVVDGEV